MLITVAKLILEARANPELGQELQQHPEQVAHSRQVDAEVTASAAFALTEMPKTKNSIWY